MYRSLMFKSNPLTEELNQNHHQNIKTLSIKNYSFSKINKNSPKKSILNNFTPNTFNAKKNRYLNNNSTISPKQILKNSFFTKNKHVQPNPQDSINFDKNSPNFHVQNQPNIRILNSRRRIYKQQQNKNISLVQKNLDSQKCKLKNIDANQQLKISDRNTRTSIKSSRISDIKLQASINSGIRENSAFNTLQKAKQQQQKDNKLKATLYQSINLDNIFQKLQFKVKEQSKQQKQQQQFPNDNFKFLQRFQKQTKFNSPKPKTAFDQFNLKFLINKKKTFKIQNQNHIKGSNMPYFQSFSSRENKKASMKSLQKSYFNDPDRFYQDNNFHSPKMIETQRSTLNKTSYLTIDSSRAHNIRNSMDIRNDRTSQQVRSDKQPIQIDNLKQSLKIQSLRQMFKHQQLKFV